MVSDPFRVAEGPNRILDTAMSEPLLPGVNELLREGRSDENLETLTGLTLLEILAASRAAA